MPSAKRRHLQSVILWHRSLIMSTKLQRQDSRTSRKRKAYYLGNYKIVNEISGQALNSTVQNRIKSAAYSK